MGRLSRPLSLTTLGAKAVAQVALISLNTYQVAHGHLPGAFVVGCAISWLWWANAGSAGKSQSRVDGFVYGLGAGIGSVLGLLISRWLYP